MIAVKCWPLLLHFCIALLNSLWDFTFYDKTSFSFLNSWLHTALQLCIRASGIAQLLLPWWFQFRCTANWAELHKIFETFKLETLMRGYLHILAIITFFLLCVDGCSWASQNPASNRWIGLMSLLTLLLLILCISYNLFPFLIMHYIEQK